MVDVHGFATLVVVILGMYLILYKVMGGNPLSFMIWIYFIVQANVSFAWLVLNRMVSRIFLIPDEPNKIAIIGDGIAAGFGDWIKMGQNGGLTRRLTEKITEDETILLKWKIFNYGHFASISDEWLPDCLRAPLYMPLLNGFYPLFNSVFKKGTPGYDAKIVIIVVGSFDCRRSEEGSTVKYTMDRITTIVNKLLEMNKYVLICSLLDVRYEYETKAEKTFMGKLNYKNTGIHKLCRENPGRVFEGANMTHVKYKTPRSVDNVHLNTDGYNTLANEVWPILKNVFARYKLDLAKKKL
jgi:lysophospholipase L1-like esterase